MHWSLHSAAIAGAGARPVEVQVDLALGLPGFHLIGLPDHACFDARTRVATALRNCGYQLPQKKVTVNLAPADLRKEGAAFDLPIALGVLASSGLIPIDGPPPMAVGELSLSGDLLPVRGVLPIAIAAQKMGIQTLIVPAPNAQEGALVQGLRVYGARTLTEAAEIFQGTAAREPARAPPPARPETNVLDLCDVRGQDACKKALQIAAAGGHNTLLIGAPGAGKTMLARRLPTLLPTLSFEEAIETTCIWSIAGKLKAGQGLLTSPPFRAPHHTISVAGLVGGGSPLRPGEISLATNGVLFLDEICEFGRAALEALRQPLEDGEVSIVRTQERATIPARFMLIGAMNPCPCGHASDPNPDRCTCTLPEKQRYLRRLSGPILDRFDLHIEARPLGASELMGLPDGEQSADVRARVERARAIQRARSAVHPGVHCNAQLRGRALRQACNATAPARAALGRIIDAKGLSARAHDRILKVARTLADLDGLDRVNEEHIGLASQYRCLDGAVGGSPSRINALSIARKVAVRSSPGNPPGEIQREGT